MINMTLCNEGLKVKGHAPRLCGQSITDDNLVCAAVSALVQTLFDALVSVGHVDVAYALLQPGDVWIKWSEMSHDGKTIIDAFKTGIEHIQNDYPEAIKFTDDR